MAHRVELVFDFVSPNAYLVWWPLRELLTLALIADCAALARAMFSGIGLSLDLRRWMRLLSMLAFSHAAFLLLR